MTDVFTLKRSFGGPQHVRSYTVWPNRARGSFSQRFRSFDPKVRPGPTEPFLAILKEPLRILRKNQKKQKLLKVLKKAYPFLTENCL